MFVNSNEKCPVCNRQFEQEDDIVICPHCGTPHHRECYNSLGHCFNADKHNTDFEYESPAEPEGKTKPQQSDNRAHNSEYDPSGQGQYYQPPKETANTENNKTVCSQCGAEISSDAPFCSHCGARQSNPQYKEFNPFESFAPSPENQSKYENENRTIDGKSVSDIAAVVRTNTEKFIPKFLKNKKISWNWSAFIFGPYYLFFRKMYKQGVIFMALNLAASLIINGIFSQQITEYMSFMSANLQSFYSNPTAELANSISAANEKIMPVLLILSGVNFIIHLIIALFSDTFYRAKAIEVLDKVDKNLEEGASFNIAPMFEETTLSQSDMKKLYLGKLGGTSFFSPVIAYCVLSLITDIITRI